MTAQYYFCKLEQICYYIATILCLEIPGALLFPKQQGSYTECKSNTRRVKFPVPTRVHKLLLYLLTGSLLYRKASAQYFTWIKVYGTSRNLINPVLSTLVGVRVKTGAVRPWDGSQLSSSPSHAGWKMKESL